MHARVEGGAAADASDDDLRPASDAPVEVDDDEESEEEEEDKAESASVEALDAGCKAICHTADTSGNNIEIKKENKRLDIFTLGFLILHATRGEIEFGKMNMWKSVYESLMNINM